MAGERGCAAIPAREGLVSAVNAALQSAADDDVLKALQADPTSAQFSTARIRELLEQAVQSEQELAIQQSHAEVLQLQAQLSAAESQIQCMNNIVQEVGDVFFYQIAISHITLHPRLKTMQMRLKWNANRHFPVLRKNKKKMDLSILAHS